MNNGNTQRKTLVNSKDTVSSLLKKEDTSQSEKLIEEQAKKSQGENGSRVHIDKRDILKLLRKKDHLKRNKIQVT